MKFLILSSATAIAGLSAAPLLAGGLDQPIFEQAPASVVVTQPAVAPRTGWGGFYIGGQIGTLNADSSIALGDILTPGEIIDFNTTFSTNFDANDDVDAELDGNFYGLHVGYMYDLGNFVLGAEVDYDQINFEELSASFEGFSESENIDEDGTIARLKFRAGYNAGRFLPYVTAGVVRLEDDDSESTDGTFFGAGAAFKATENILIGGEVLQHQFDDAFDTGLDVEATTVSLRASYRF